MYESFGSDILSYYIFKVLFETFKLGNEPRSGCPIEVHCEQLKQIIDQDRNVSS